MSDAMRTPLLIFCFWLAWLPLPVHSHSLAPLLLEVEVSDQSEFQVMLRRSARSTAGLGIDFVFPPNCEFTEEWSVPQLTDLYAEQSAKLRCNAQGLAGNAIAAKGLHRSGVAVLVRIKSEGETLHLGLLDESQPAWQVPEEPSALEVGSQYLKAGFEHLLIGFDHVLLVVALSLLVTGLGRLLLIVTAFTFGHSLSLAAASLSWISLPQASVEILIAASLVPLALELLKPERSTWRRWLPVLAVAIGLLHGLGFAGVLSEIGLPANDKLLALFAFNLGIELAQVLLVCAVLLFRRLAMKTNIHSAEFLLRVAPAYVIGSIACYWCLERIPAAMS